MTRRRAAREDALPFESALARLEAIVEELEGGELALEAALSAFEEGVALSRRCAGQLEDAERRIEELVGEGATRPLAGLEADDAPEGEEDDPD